MPTFVVVDCDKTNARLSLGDERTTLPKGNKITACLGKERGIVLKVQPFALNERDFGNRTMTTTVIIHPHPGPGLKVQVDTISPVDGGVQTTEFLKAGDPVKTLYAHDGMAVKVSEVPDEPMREVEGDTLTSIGDIGA